VAHVDRVFIDTSELFPYTVMDVLLTLSEDRLFDWVWTDELLDEWERVIVREKHRTPASARSVTDAVQHWFATSRIDPESYRHQITDDLSPDVGDRAHVAACLGGQADVIVTRNIDDFTSPRLVQAGVRVMTADDYLVELLRHRPRAVQESFIGAAASRSRPTTTPCELVERLRRAGTRTFATRLSRRLGCS
jgi:predicted nucleic acid-binding protein